MKELEKLELVEVCGGVIQLPFWVKGSIWVLAATYIIDHWADIKSGIVDGYKDGLADNK
jgi:hypothetical protein